MSFLFCENLETSSFSQHQIHISLGGGNEDLNKVIFACGLVVFVCSHTLLCHLKTKISIFCWSGISKLKKKPKLPTIKDIISQSLLNLTNNVCFSHFLPSHLQRGQSCWTRSDCRRRCGLQSGTKIWGVSHLFSCFALFFDAKMPDKIIPGLQMARIWRKRRGPRVLPCGTPNTLCIHLIKNKANQTQVKNLLNFYVT